MDQATKDKIRFRHLTWDDIELSCNIIRNQMIKDKYHPEAIIGLLRGGVVPARIFSDYFHILLDFFAIDVKLYDGINKRKEKPIVGTFNYQSIRGKKILIVDDIYDSGKTMQAVLGYLDKEDVTTATLFWKETTGHKPTYYANIAKKDEWIVFPWEKNEFEKEVNEA